jgi:hypothetical protein
MGMLDLPVSLRFLEADLMVAEWWPWGTWNEVSFGTLTVRLEREFAQPASWVTGGIV